MRSQLVDIMKTLKMPLVSCGSNWDVVRKSITAAYAHSLSQRPVENMAEYARPRHCSVYTLKGTVCLSSRGCVAHSSARAMPN